MSATGDDPRYHAIKDGAFVCTAPADARCRTSPTCDCERWCGCDGSPEDAQDTHGGDHCCMTTTRAGQQCWIEPWVNELTLDGSFDHQAEASAADYDLVTGEHAWPDGPVVCDWDDCIIWKYADPSPAALDRTGAGE